jgi:hypothetical protein
VYTLRTGLTGLLCFVCTLQAVVVGADAPVEPPPTNPSELQRLVATLGDEPLLIVGIKDVKTLPERFAGTNLSKMLVDPSYAKGLATIITLLNQNTGINVKEFCSRASKLLDGPVAISITPDGENLAFTCYALTANDDTARELAAIWPHVEETNKLFSVLKLKTVQPKDLPAEQAALPDWAGKNWPAGDLAVIAAPRKLAKAAEKAIAAGKLDASAPKIDDTQVDHAALGLSIDGENFTDSLTLEVAPDADTTFTHVVSALKEKPKGWDSLLAAMPADGDIAVLLQSDPKALATDLPFALQPLERNLRGKRWAKKQGVATDALDPARFDFLINHLHGELGISAKPTITAELHLCMAGALKAGEVETVRADLMKGLEDITANFDTLQGVPKIGGVAPLGAQFQGRGIFTAPVIGLSTGWAWLCSNLATYHELTTAFTKGKTLANAIKAENARLSADGKKVEMWRPEDALRVQINLEKVVQLAYTAWLLSGEDGPFIAGWRVPSDMLPPPQLFAGHLGSMHVGMGRSGKTLSGYSHCVIPGTSAIAVALMQQLAAEIDTGREFSKNPPPPPPERPATAIKQKKKPAADDTAAQNDESKTQAAKPKGDRP